MTIAPLFEWIAVIAMSAMLFSASTPNFAFERERASASRIATEMTNLAPHIQSYCNANGDDCDGASFDVLVSAGYLNAAASTQDQADHLIINTFGGNDFDVNYDGTFDVGVLGFVQMQIGAQPDITYLAYCTNHDGLVASDQPDTCF